MAENTKIEWTAQHLPNGEIIPGHTFNPWIGCTKVSNGCKNCYALDLMETRYQRVKWGPQGTRDRTSDANWRKPLAWNRKAKAEGRRYRVFCASLADVFEDRPELAPWRADLLQMIIETPHLDWLLLTKRPENVNRMVEQATGFSDSEMWFHAARNIWIGTSVENQVTADERIPHLLRIPARVRFLSMEPLLGPVDIVRGGHLWARGILSEMYEPPIQWVIVGGESGQHARPMHPDWARFVRNQCEGLGIAFHFKQWGEWLPDSQVTDDQRPALYSPSSESIGGIGEYKKRLVSVGGGEGCWKVGKHAAGRLLDGREWNESPQ